MNTFAYDYVNTLSSRSSNFIKLQSRHRFPCLHAAKGRVYFDCSETETRENRLLADEYAKKTSWKKWVQNKAATKSSLFQNVQTQIFSAATSAVDK